VPILCFDIGNTHTHWGLVNKLKVLKHGEFSTRLLNPKDIQNLIKEHQPQGIALASVVPAVSDKLKEFFKNINRPFIQLRFDNIVGLGFDYPNPAEVGQDRLADCIGAQILCGAPAVIIGMGTATTVDILTKKGYAGGIIAPGLGVMTQYLHERTALLPELDSKNLLGSPVIGKSTVDAMKSGCVMGFAGMIGALLDGVILEMTKNKEAPPQVIVTGGAAVYLPKSWQNRVIHEPHLSLIGLAEFYYRTHP
jgi:type III pantothenate kinase